jgi:cytochrome oxidase Cu insertion factor (SCO1/SenC/PrrC family)
VITRPSNPKLTGRVRGARAGLKSLIAGGLGLQMIGVLVVIILVAGGIALLQHQHQHQHQQDKSANLIRPTGLPASISTQLASVMALSPVPPTTAHAFTLTDQRGRTVSLASFRGRVVVLEFMDSHCIDICPIVSQELIDANRDLGTASNRVAFIAVNVNKYHASVTDVSAFSREHRLNSIKSWHFLTGAPSKLRSIWAAYGITVESPSPTADVIHSSFVFFIDAQGRERYLANPTDLHTASGRAYLPPSSLTEWGRGIALVVESFKR